MPTIIQSGFEQHTSMLRLRIGNLRKYRILCGISINHSKQKFKVKTYGDIL